MVFVGLFLQANYVESLSFRLFSAQMEIIIVSVSVVLWVKRINHPFLKLYLAESASLRPIKHYTNSRRCTAALVCPLHTFCGICDPTSHETTLTKTSEFLSNILATCSWKFQEITRKRNERGLQEKVQSRWKLEWRKHGCSQLRCQAGILGCLWFSCYSHYYLDT